MDLLGPIKETKFQEFMQKFQGKGYISLHKCPTTLILYLSKSPSNKSNGYREATNYHRPCNVYKTKITHDRLKSKRVFVTSQSQKRTGRRVDIICLGREDINVLFSESLYYPSNYTNRGRRSTGPRIESSQICRLSGIPEQPYPTQTSSVNQFLYSQR